MFYTIPLILPDKDMCQAQDILRGYMNIEKIIKITRVFSYVFARIGCLALLMMMGVTVVDVVGRFVFNSPILGSFEITQYLVVVLVFSFIGYAQSEKWHVNVDILVNTFPKKTQSLIDLLNCTVSLILMILITWMGIEKALESLATGDKPMNLPIPQYPFVFFLAFGCGVLCIEFFRDILKTFGKNKKKEI
ncbi:TRAP transporter small permease [Desulfopila aestuarii]|uniref:TRAP-type C4-dicarboxylate transport system, small permease component n=1 Tax=Desulfopila aestuarii DSM 18488 TaxID=1121416 RepID=A0A1M7XYH7_9BACT|nr:TRAP transporter small permease [Desulfopila aestuarii]SHO44085.1 TRAP-type C4-dicarboxylate transport system, small permease component [Desulfopila aestuarii DSM 18488]